MNESASAAKPIRDLLKKFLNLYLPALTIITFAATRIVEAIELVVKTKLPDHYESAIHQINSISTTFLLCEILAYLVLERSDILHPLEQIIATITLKVQELKDVIVDKDTMESLLDSKQEVLLEEIKEPASIRVYKTPQEAYDAIPQIVDLIDRTVRGEKRMMHGLLHLSPLTSDLKNRAPVPSALAESQAVFDQTMFRCIESSGVDRWFVQQIYNITTIDRLNTIEERLRRGPEGFEVRAVSIPDMFPCFSPLIIGENDATLAIADSANYRVGSAMHLHGREAIKFIERYFDMLWDYGGMFRLRSEQGIDRSELERLRRTIESRSKVAGHKKS